LLSAFGLHLVRPNHNPVDEAGERRKYETRQSHRLDDAFPEPDEVADGTRMKVAAMHESVPGRYCCKSRKSTDAENLAKVDF
jgi:hypothetical protein